MIYSGAFFVASLAFYQSGNRDEAYTVLCFGLLSLCFFPLYQKWYYKNHFQKFIADAYKNRFDRTVTITSADDYITVSDGTSESTITLKEIENITETGDYFFLKMRMGGHLIIPKLKIDNIDSVRENLKKICERLSIEFINDLNWRWK